MAGKISIVSQIAEIDREIAIRMSFYPRQVQAGKMRQMEAEMLLDRAHAIRATLVFCQDNEADIRAYISAKKTGGA